MELRSNVSEISQIFDVDDYQNGTDNLNEVKELIKGLEMRVEGKIVIAEDNALNIELMRSLFKELNLLK